MKKRTSLTFGIALAALALSSCSSKSSDNGSDTVNGSTGTLLIQFKPVGKPTSTGFSMAASASDFKNSAIASGRPDSLTLYITNMSVEGTDGVKTIFDSVEGKAISVRDKTIDISELFTNYACVDGTGTPVEGVGECPCGLDENKTPVAIDPATNSCPDSGNGAVGSVPLATGTFTKLSVKFSVRAKVKGCVTGDFSTGSSSGTHTYCTKADASTFQSTPGVAAASALENITAEEMDYQLPKANQLYTNTSETFTMEFPIEGGLTLTEGGASPLMTMVIDTNRMLRFYNMNQTKNPNPGMSDSRAYFFNTVFEESTFVFVGAAGDIRGFKWWTEACTDYASNATCSGNGSIVAGWMTIVKDSSGKPLVVGLMPDDDNSLTIVKGSNKSSDGIDNSAFTASGTKYDVGFQLGEGNSGKISGVNLDAEVGSTQTTTFVGLQNYGGTMYLERGL